MSCLRRATPWVRISLVPLTLCVILVFTLGAPHQAVATSSGNAPGSGNAPVTTTTNTTTEVIQGTHIRIVSTADWPAASQLRVVGAAVWDLTITADAPRPGSLEVMLSANGGTPVLVAASRCASPWTPSGCADAPEQLRANAPLSLTGEVFSLSEHAASEVFHLRVTVALDRAKPETAVPTRVHLRVSGTEETLSVTSGDALATTGGPPAWPTPLFVAAILLLSGIVTLLVRAFPRSLAIRSHHRDSAGVS